MKKILSIALACMMTLSLAACGNNGGNEGTPDGANAENGEKTIKVSVFAGSLPKNTPTGAGVEFFVNELNEKSGGSIQATAFYDTELGDATSMIQGLQQGTVDIGVCGDAYYSGLVPEIQAFELPFIFEDIDAARAAVNGEAKDVIFDLLAEKGIVGLSFWEGGMRQLSNNVRPIKTPADLKGIPMRTLPAAVQVAAWKALGALPTSIDSSELYSALELGTVSAQENPLSEIEFRKFYEVQDYVSLTNHVYTPFLLSMSKMTWDKMSENQRQIVMDAAVAAQEVQRNAAAEADAAAKQILLDNNVQIEEAPDVAAFREMTSSVYSIFTDQCPEHGQQLIDLIQG